VVVGNALVKITSLDEVQVPFVMVHRSVALVLHRNTCNSDVLEAAVVIVAVPLTTDHDPVPLLCWCIPRRIKHLHLEDWLLPALPVGAS
jgi:hypothetical protein